MLLPRLLRTPCGLSTRITTKSDYSGRLLARPFSTSWRRNGSLAVSDESLANLPGIDPSKLEVTKTITPKELVPNENLVFGQTFTGQSMRRHSYAGIR